MNLKNKILIVTDTWDPQLNGVVTALKKTILELEKKGHSVLLIHPGIFATVPLVFSPEIKFAVHVRKALEKQVEAFQPDYIHIATEWPLGMAMRRLCLRKKWRFTSSFHTHVPNYIAYYGWMAPQFFVHFVTEFVYKHIKRFHRSSARVMVATEHLKQELEGRGIRNVAVVPLGVDAQFFVEGEKPHTALQRPLFIYVGRLAREKNVEAFLKLSLPGSKLLVGDGPSRKRLEKKYADAQFVGYKKGKELVEFLASADAMVFPSKTETFGLVVLEALACGVPVAAYNVMGPKDILTQGVDGILSEDLQAAALECLKLSPEKCRKRARQFTWEKATEQFIKNLVPVHAE